MYVPFDVRNEKLTLLSICGLRANRICEGRTSFGLEGEEEAHLMSLVIVYHETFNIQKVKNALLNSVYNVKG
jgi:hypothetical protein